MSRITKLEKLCSPILTCLCNYWQLANIDKELSKEQFQRDLELRLEDTREAAARDPDLEQDFAKMERPLIFFIDYIVKEGNFPFSEEWREFARNYNELSGDEKFFNLFTEALDNPEADETIVLYYLMLGLGFDGIYRSDPGYIRGCMKRCADRFPDDIDIYSEPIVTVNPEKRMGKKKWFSIFSIFSVRSAIVISLVFMVVCFLINFFTFSKTTATYRQLLTSTSLSTVPQEAITIYEMQQSKSGDN
jgi:type VI protein secretion system component VasF